MRKMGAQMAEARPDTIVIASPHNLRLRRHIGVVISENSTGAVGTGRRRISLRALVDVHLATQILEASEAKGLPVVGANYGTFTGRISDLPMDFGTLIPLWFLLRENHLKSRIVIVTPSREIPPWENLRFGRTLAEVCESRKSRVAMVASADQAHAHRRDGPYGYSEMAAEYDQRVVKAVSRGDLASILRFKPSFVASARPDSYWQMLMLAGALEVAPMRPEVFSYEVPTYFGMICAGFLPP